MKRGLAVKGLKNLSIVSYIKRYVILCVLCLTESIQYDLITFITDLGRDGASNKNLVNDLKEKEREKYIIYETMIKGFIKEFD